MFRRILCATDFSPASRGALRLAVALAGKSRARLLIAHVVSPVGILDVEAIVRPRIRAALEAAMRRSAEKRLAALLARARRSHVAAEAIVLSGVPDEALTRAARRSRVDLVVMGTHGRSGVERVLLGSVASKVIATAPCPVLTVRARRRSS